MVVAHDVDLVERGLLALADTYLQIHGVSHHIGLNGYDAVKHVTVVVVLIGNGVVISLAHIEAEAFLEQLLIIDVAAPELQRVAESVG